MLIMVDLVETISILFDCFALKGAIAMVMVRDDLKIKAVSVASNYGVKNKIVVEGPDLKIEEKDQEENSVTPVKEVGIIQKVHQEVLLIDFDDSNNVKEKENGR